MLLCKVKPGFATLNLATQTAHLALTAYVNGNVKCLRPHVAHMVEVVVQSKTLWVEAESLTDSDCPEEPFCFIFDEEQVAA